MQKLAQKGGPWDSAEQTQSALPVAVLLHP